MSADLIKSRLVYAGWCHEGKSDKVWVLMHKDTTDAPDPVFSQYTQRTYEFVAFWGKRGKSLRSTTYTETLEYWNGDRELHDPVDHVDIMRSLIVTKHNKGYINIPKDELDKVYPEFENDLNESAFMSIMGFI